MKLDKKDLLLYAVTDRSWTYKEDLYVQVEKALKGGATFIQLREKDLSDSEFLNEAKEIQNLCSKYKIPFVVNDNVDIALKIGADGVHIGQSDMKADDVRALLGDDKIIGVSAHTVEEAVNAQNNGADYLGVGAIFHTNSKKDASTLNYEILKDICNAVDIPVIAIGGITKENVAQLSGSGICGVAVISAIFSQPDIESAARELKSIVNQQFGINS